ncbi:hypothetical protein SPURM210S_07322 [Streptomyces purpurascens]
MSERTYIAPMPRPSDIRTMSLVIAKAAMTPSKEKDASKTSR